MVSIDLVCLEKQCSAQSCWNCSKAVREPGGYLAHVFVAVIANPPLKTFETGVEVTEVDMWSCLGLMMAELRA